MSGPTNLAGGRVVHARLVLPRGFCGQATMCGRNDYRDAPTEQPVTCKRCLKSLAVNERAAHAAKEER